MKVDAAAIVAQHQVLSDVYSERSLLAAILFDQRALAHLTDLEIGDFYPYQHAAIFTAIRNLESAGADVTVATVFDELGRMDTERRVQRGESHLLDHCAPEIVDMLAGRVAMDASPEELRWHFGHVRRARLRRERLAA